MRTIKVISSDGTFEVSEIPDNAKITYGGVRPDQPGLKTNTLRIYTSANNQLAVFQGVLSFHDLSLKLTRPVKKDWVD